MSVHCGFCGCQRCESGSSTFVRITLDDYFNTYFDNKGISIGGNPCVVLPKLTLGFHHIGCLIKVFKIGQNKLMKNGTLENYEYLNDFSKLLNKISKELQKIEKEMVNND